MDSFDIEILPSSSVPGPSEVLTGSDGAGVLSERGHFITPEDAFEVYFAPGKGSRSLRKTAKLCGVKEGTVASWSRRYGWQQKAADMDMEVTEGVGRAYAVALVGQALNNLATLITIRDDVEVSSKDRIAAANALNTQLNKQLERAAVQQMIAGPQEDLEESELAALAQSPDGVNQLLARLRERTGMA